MKRFVSIREISTHEIKRRLLLGRKVMTKLDSILKTRDREFEWSEKVVNFAGKNISCDAIIWDEMYFISKTNSNTLQWSKCSI